MRDNDSAIVNSSIAVTNPPGRDAGGATAIAKLRSVAAGTRRHIVAIWTDLYAGQEALFHQPWEREGNLRWVKAPGGPRLVGRGLDPERFAAEADWPRFLD